VSDGQQAPGWYPDPWGQAQSRWWDGTQWTEQTQAGGAPAAPAGKKRSTGKTVAIVVGALVALFVLLGVVGLLLGLGDGKFDENEFAITFEYPRDLEETDDVSLTSQLGSGAEETRALALDENNALIVQKYRLNIDANAGNLDSTIKPELDNLLGQVSPGATSVRKEYGGLPALEYDSIKLTNPANGTSRLIFLFDGRDEYEINCQWTPDEREKIQDACDKALDTLEKR
jgi:hypothetical protein